MSLFAELKRRNVFRVGIAYVLTAWILAQAADFALDLIGAPNWILQSIVVLIALGFPIALIFAWAFEMTPEGIKRESEVDREASLTPQTGKKLDRMIIGVMAIVIGFLLVDRFFLQDRAPTPQPQSQQEAAAETQNAKSIAVLPFADLSQDQDQRWFADGLAEEILNALARTPDLLVSSRTSSFKYRDTELDIPQIAEELGNNRAANTVMLAFWAAIEGAVSREAMRQSVADSVPPKTVKVNLEAFDVGYDKGLDAVAQRDPSRC